MVTTITNLIRPAFRRVRESLDKLRPSNAKTVWKANLHTEVEFWDHWFATKGDLWPENYSEKLAPNSELAPEVARFLPADDQPVDILDVGAGPLTALGKKHKGRKLRIVAVDPLAEEYESLLSKYGVVPVVRTIRGEAELLLSQFGRDSFDLVYAHNCIDHSYSPEKAIREMVGVVRKDGVVVLWHGINEAERAGYEGLHQWNFSLEHGDFIISSKTSKLNFTDKYADLCEVSCTAEGPWIETIIRRKA